MTKKKKTTFPIGPNLEGDLCEGCGHPWNSHGLHRCYGQRKMLAPRGRAYIMEACSCNQGWYINPEHPTCFMCEFCKIIKGDLKCSKGNWRGKKVDSEAAQWCADFVNAADGVCKCGRRAIAWGMDGSPVCQQCYSKYEETVL